MAAMRPHLLSEMEISPVAEAVAPTADFALPFPPQPASIGRQVLPPANRIMAELDPLFRYLRGQLKKGKFTYAKSLI